MSPYTLKQKGRLVRPFFVASNVRAAINTERSVHPTGMVRRRRLHEHDPRVRCRYRTMLNAGWDHDHLSRANVLHGIAKTHFQRPLHDVEHFVFLIVRMPHELPFDFGQLDLLAIEFRHHVRGPLGIDQRVFLVEVDGFHGKWG